MVTRSFFRGKYDVSTDNPDATKIKNLGTSGLYEQARGKAKDFAKEKFNSASAWDTVKGQKNAFGGQTTQELVNAIAYGATDISFVEKMNTQQTIKALNVAYYLNNQVPNDPYEGAISTLAKHLQVVGFNSCQTIDDCIRFENKIVDIIRAADAEGGKYVNPTRYQLIDDDVKELRQMKKNGGAKDSQNSNPYVAHINEAGMTVSNDTDN